tara:strand:+ start:255 stop:545 length:291 start_codon:yes stop_codon:yes gene_type:complete
MKHTIKVIEEDIINGEPGTCSRCAIALALKRHFKTNNTMVRINDKSGVVDIDVDKKNFRVNDMHVGYVGDFIFDFDDVEGSSQVKPIEFEIIENDF